MTEKSFEIARQIAAKKIPFSRECREEGLNSITDKRILKVIEGLTMGELDHLDPQKSLDQIYTFAHLAGECKNKHADWRKEFIGVERALVKLGVI